jgi:hypothetical protein
MDIKKEAKLSAEKLHIKYVSKFDEPMDGDGIADAVKGFREELRTLSGDK